MKIQYFTKLYEIEEKCHQSEFYALVPIRAAYGEISNVSWVSGRKQQIDSGILFSLTTETWILQTIMFGVELPFPVRQLCQNVWKQVQNNPYHEYLSYKCRQFFRD